MASVDTSMIIPCFNEEGNIVKCVNRVPKLPWPYKIVAVNDGSEGRALEKLQGIQRQHGYPLVKHFQLPNEPISVFRARRKFNLLGQSQCGVL